MIVGIADFAIAIKVYGEVQTVQPPENMKCE